MLRTRIGARGMQEYKSAVSRENSMLIAFKFPVARPYRSSHRIDLEMLGFRSERVSATSRLALAPFLSRD